MNCRKERNPFITGKTDEALESCRADASCWHVDDAPQTHRVVAVANHAEVSNQVFDFHSVVESHAADNLIGDVGGAECFLENAGLRVSAIENGEVRIVHTFGVPFLNFSADVTRFVVFIDCLVADDLFADVIFRPQLFLSAADVVVDDSPRRVQDILGGTVVLLQP